MPTAFTHQQALNWTKERIAALAPHPATLDRAQSLTNTRKWRSLATDGNLLWGECRSSGALYYACAVDLESGAATCSCPKPHFPCKHVLALLLLLNSQTAAFHQEKQRPVWVETWRRQGPKALVMEDEEAASRRREEKRQGRIEDMRSGAADLEQWLLDLLRQGLASAAQQPDAYWEEMAARLVDAKLNAPARRIRQWRLLMGAANWPEQLLGEMAELFTLARALRQFERLPAPLQQEVLVASGVTIKREAVLAGVGVSDYWLVIGRESGADENLRYRRSWLLGARRQHPALLLEFAWGDNPFEIDWPLGSAWKAEMVFYPGAYPIRAIPRRYEPSTEPFEIPGGYPDFEAFLQEYAQALGRSPWISLFPALLDQVLPLMAGQELLLIDREEKQIALALVDPWPLLALSAGKRLSLFGVWNGRSFRPLCAIAQGRLVSL